MNDLPLKKYRIKSFELNGFKLSLHIVENGWCIYFSRQNKNVETKFLSKQLGFTLDDAREVYNHMEGKLLNALVL